MAAITNVAANTPGVDGESEVRDFLMDVEVLAFLAAEKEVRKACIANSGGMAEQLYKVVDKVLSPLEQGIMVHLHKKPAGKQSFAGVAAFLGQQNSILGSSISAAQTLQLVNNAPLNTTLLDLIMDDRLLGEDEEDDDAIYGKQLELIDLVKKNLVESNAQRKNAAASTT